MGPARWGGHDGISSLLYDINLRRINAVTRGPRARRGGKGTEAQASGFSGVAATLMRRATLIPAAAHCLAPSGTLQCRATTYS